eukprot:3919243-Prorocentrum_lima.AAC.1
MEEAKEAGEQQASGAASSNIGMETTIERTRKKPILTYRITQIERLQLMTLRLLEEATEEWTISRILL